MFLSIIVPLMYYFKIKDQIAEKRKYKWKEGRGRKEYDGGLPGYDMCLRDIHGPYPEIHNWPYGPDDICHINPCPKTLEEYYAYKPTFLRSKEFCSAHAIPPPRYPTKLVGEKPASIADPYEGKPETDEDRRRRAAWDEYRMDYMGVDASDNIIEKITDTLHEPQHHPHTYLPLNDEIPLIPGHHPFHYPPADPNCKLECRPAKIGANW